MAVGVGAALVSKFAGKAVRLDQPFQIDPGRRGVRRAEIGSLRREELADGVGLGRSQRLQGDQPIVHLEYKFGKLGSLSSAVQAATRHGMPRNEGGVAILSVLRPVMVKAAQNCRGQGGIVQHGQRQQRLARIEVLIVVAILRAQKRAKRAVGVLHHLQEPGQSGQLALIG